VDKVFAVPLDGIKDLTIRELGGKGYSLAILLDNSFNIPEGFVVTSQAFFEFLEHNNSLGMISDLASEIGIENFTVKSKEMKDIVLAGVFPEEISCEIGNQLGTMNAENVAVRSSALSEDSANLSFAGLHDTFLNMKAELNLVLETVKNCLASLFNERALVYRLRKGVPYLEGMAVIVQRMIPAAVSGTTFTVHPDTRKENMLVVECSWGLGETVVGGKVTPDRFIVRKDDLQIIDRRLGRKKIMIKGGKNGTIEVATPTNKQHIFCANDDLIRNICKVCISIEKLFLSPQDIEWCISKDEIWILQSRAITV